MCDFALMVIGQEEREVSGERKEERKRRKGRGVFGRKERRGETKEVGANRQREGGREIGGLRGNGEGEK